MDKGTLHFKTTIPVKYNVDIMVAGGGPAGSAAAIVASRQKKKVFLAEAHTCLGGMGTAGLVPAFCTFSDGKNFLAGGIGKELFLKLRARGGVHPPEGRGIKAEILKRLYEELMLKAGVKFTYHTRVIDVLVRKGVVTECICASKSGLFAVRAKVFIDATGDGDLAYFAGAGYEKGDENGTMMPGTVCSLWAGIDWIKVKNSGIAKSNEIIDKAIRDRVFTIRDRHISGIWPVGETLGGGNIGHTFNVDGTDEESLTEAYIWGRKIVPEFERFYKEYLSGYEDMELAATGSLMGIRETRRIKGDYVLKLNDFETRAVFADEIGRYSYPVDIHPVKPGKKDFNKFLKEFGTYRMKKGESYGIPYRILTPEGLKNILVSGRCISTDRFMQSSIRVMPGSYITGQAAGMAASLMVEQKTDSRGIDVRLLQKKLKKAGAYLPNAK